MVSTQDSDSCNPGSIPGTTFAFEVFFFFFHFTNYHLDPPLFTRVPKAFLLRAKLPLLRYSFCKELGKVPKISKLCEIESRLLGNIFFFFFFGRFSSAAKAKSNASPKHETFRRIVVHHNIYPYHKSGEVLTMTTCCYSTVVCAGRSLFIDNTPWKTTLLMINSRRRLLPKTRRETLVVHLPSNIRKLRYNPLTIDSLGLWPQVDERVIVLVVMC